MEIGKDSQDYRSFLSRVLKRRKPIPSQLASAQLESSQLTSFLKPYYELLISKTRWIDSRASSVKAGIETLNSHEGDFDKRVSILSRALLKQLAEKRVTQSAYDTVTANVLDTPQRTKDALVDIMSNTE